MKKIVSIIAFVAFATVSSFAQKGKLSDDCLNEFLDLTEKDNFVFDKFLKDFIAVVPEVKLKAKLPFGAPKDKDITKLGVRTLCIKQLPEDLGALQSLLMNQLGPEVGKRYIKAKCGIEEIPDDPAGIIKAVADAVNEGLCKGSDSGASAVSSDDEDEEEKPKKKGKKPKDEDEDEDDDKKVKRGLYFDIGLGFGTGSTKINGHDMYDELNDYFSSEMKIYVTIFKLGYGPIGNHPIYAVMELGGMGHRISDASSGDWIQFNSYIFGPGIIFYPIPLIQLGASAGLSFAANSASDSRMISGAEEGSGGFAYNISAAVDLGGGNHGLLLGVQYFSATSELKQAKVDQESQFIGFFIKYAYRHKPVILEE